MVSIMKTDSPRLISDRPISSIQPGVKASATAGRADTSPDAKARPTTPAADSRAPVAPGTASVRPWARLTIAFNQCARETIVEGFDCAAKRP